MKTSSDHDELGPELPEALRSLANRWQIHPDRIVRARRESEAFQEICADYEECCAKLVSLEKDTDANDHRLRDYLEMRDHLERDLERCLKGEVPGQEESL